MKRIRIFTMMIAIAAIGSILAGDIFAETRTLTTTLIITIRPRAPETQNAPAPVRDTLSTALAQSTNQRFVKVDPSAATGTGDPRYTMMEKL